MFLLGSKKNDSKRAYELDFLRGIAIVMMVFMHFSYDVRYEFGVNTFRYLEADYFWTFIHPIITGLFVSISGVCCTMSRSNFKRGARLLGIALLFTFTTLFIYEFMGIDVLIIFNVLHVLALSTLVYALFVFIEKKTKINYMGMTLIIGLIGIYIMLINNELSNYDYVTSNLMLLPIGIKINGTPSMGDYMPLVPWMGVFLLGAVIGRSCYKDKKTLFPNPKAVLRKITEPFEFLGRHSLLIYLVHQPVIYGILYVIFKLMGKV